MDEHLLSSILTIRSQLSNGMKDRFNRVLPFQEHLSDRWEKARELGCGEGTSVYESSYIYGDVKIGAHTWVGPYTLLDGSGGLTIGDYCSISAGVHIYSHDSIKWSLSGGVRQMERSSVAIGSCCHIGAGAVIVRGVTIGDHCVIGAGAIVTKSVPPYSIVMGIPARICGRVEIDPVSSDVKLVYLRTSAEGATTLGRAAVVPVTKTRAPIRVLMFYDAEGWAWHNKSRVIQSLMPGDINVDVRELYTPYRPEDYDLILVFDHYPTKDPRWIAPRNKTIVGCSCPRLVEETISAVSGEGFRAGFVNNLDTYQRVSHLGNCFCCQNGVDTELFVPCDSPPGEWIACWTGSSHSMGEKGLDLITEACNQTGTLLRYLDRMEQPGLAIYPQTEIRDSLYHQSTFYICASKWEGTPNPALEALACGLPVISTKVGNMTELLKDGYNGFLVERSVDSIKSAIIALKSLSIGDMRKNARMSVDPTWSWKNMAKNYERMFRSLVS